jgi:hypothetical protein
MHIGLRKKRNVVIIKFDCVVGVSETVKNGLQQVFTGVKNAMCLYNPIDSEDIIRKSMDIIPH